jgi:glycosyltransferase involved in cell wall biosynthesis
MLETRLYNAAAKHRLLARAKPIFRTIERGVFWLERNFEPATQADRGKLGLDVAAKPSRGINLAGYLRAELGIADVARRLILSIEHAGIPLATVTYSRTASRQEFPLRELAAQTAPYDTNLVCVNADQLPGFAEAAGASFFADRYTVGVWFWEVDVFPQALWPAFDLVDEVWVASDFVRRALAAVATKPLNIVPVPLEGSAVEPLARASLNLPESFLFFFTFDFMSVVERKNPFAVLSAFTLAFTPRDGAALLIKSINGDRHRKELERLRAAAADRPDVYVIDGYQSPEMKDGLMAASDCYVSLHRSEGLGLTMAEAMSYGKPVIATGYSGNLTFMDEENSYLVPYSLTEVPADCGPYPAEARWAEPDVEHAATLMRQVWANRDEAFERGRRARHDIATRHSFDRTADFIVQRTDDVHSESATTARDCVSSPARSVARGR